MSNHLTPAARAKGARSVQAFAAAMAMTAAFAASAATPADRPAAPDNAGLTRAEVVADLALWRRAGLDRYEVLATSHGLETQAYRAAQQEYLRLRNSEQFQIEVQKALKE